MQGARNAATETVQGSTTRKRVPRNAADTLRSNFKDSFLVFLAQPQLDQPIAQGAETYPQQLGGGCLVVAGFVERLDDGLLFDGFQIFRQWLPVAV